MNAPTKEEKFEKLLLLMAKALAVTVGGRDAVRILQLVAELEKKPKSLAGP